MMTISASSSAITCNNNGTPTNPNDDTFTFTLNVTGTGVGTTWKALDALNYTTGTYGTPKTMGPYPISAGNVVLQIWDSNSPNCTTTSLTVTPPATCSNTCPERPCVPMTAAKN